MSEAVIVALLSGLLGGGGAVTAVLTYWQHKRLTAGDVKTSPAEELWRAMNTLREQQAEEIRALRAEISRLRDELSVRDSEIATLRVQVRLYEQRIEELENELAGLRATGGGDHGG